MNYENSINNSLVNILDGLVITGGNFDINPELYAEKVGGSRNIKDKKYPFWRLDVLFSNKKYSNLRFIENGGWHFSNIKSPNAIHHKLKSYLHHREFDLSLIHI